MNTALQEDLALCQQNLDLSSERNHELIEQNSQLKAKLEVRFFGTFFEELKKYIFKSTRLFQQLAAQKQFESQARQENSNQKPRDVANPSGQLSEEEIPEDFVKDGQLQSMPITRVEKPGALLSSTYQTQVSDWVRC